VTLRLAVVAVCCAVLGAGLGACGGGGDDGKKTGYERALNRFCSAMEQGTSKVQTDAAAVQSAGTQTPSQAVKRIGGVLGTFATTMDGALTKLKAVDVPGTYKTFNADVVKGVGDLVTKLRAAAKQAEAGNVKGVQALSSSLTNKLPGLPAELAKNAPACGRIT
jgi:hypothetical protein